MLGLPFKETLDTYPSLDSIMRVVEQEDLRDKGENFFEELLGQIEIKNAIAAKVYQNKFGSDRLKGRNRNNKRV